MKLPYLCLACVLGCLIVGFASLSAFALDDADSMQCDNGIVLVGDSKFEVQTKCGEPSTSEERGNVWIYNFGPTEFVYYVTFTDDIVERIQVNGFGN